jgi:hypothetical protein
MIERKRIGEVECYRGHEIEARYMGPDLLAYVDGSQVGCYWIDAESARAGARRYVDQIEDEKRKRV